MKKMEGKQQKNGSLVSKKYKKREYTQILNKHKWVKPVNKNRQGKM